MRTIRDIFMREANFTYPFDILKVKEIKVEGVSTIIPAGAIVTVTGFNTHGDYIGEVPGIGTKTIVDSQTWAPVKSNVIKFGRKR